MKHAAHQFVQIHSMQQPPIDALAPPAEMERSRFGIQMHIVDRACAPRTVWSDGSFLQQIPTENPVESSDNKLTPAMGPHLLAPASRACCYRLERCIIAELIEASSGLTE